MAATLTLVKSRIAPAALGGRRRRGGARPARQLVQQLLEYQRYREAALALSERPWLHRDVFVREPTMDAPADAAADGVPPRVQVTMGNSSRRSAASEAGETGVGDEVIVEPVSLRDRIRVLLRTLGVAASWSSTVCSTRQRRGSRSSSRFWRCWS